MIIDNRIDPLTAVHFYGLMSIVMASAMPLLWMFVMRDNSFNTGFKVSAYVNLIFATPYGFFYLLFFILGEARWLASWLDTTMRFSVAGPWFFNFYAIYVIIYLCITETSSAALNYAALAAYLAYSVAAMYF